jgi:4-amino-4-deoxy-L-arabinose transferase-like glycosyltransferase
MLKLLRGRLERSLMSFLSRHASWAYAAIALLGVALAASGLERIPFTQGDDATYFSTARSLKVFVEWSGQHWRAITTGSADGGSLRARYDEEGIAFALPYYSKPLFDLIYWAALVLWGAKLQSILYVNVLCFAAAIYWMGRVGERLFNARIGLTAALFLATSGSALVYARTGMAHMASMAIFLLGADLYLRLWGRGWRGAQQWRTGAVWGASLAIHPNLVPYVGLCGLAGAVCAWRDRGMSSLLAHAGGLALGALGVAISIEVSYQLVGVALGDVLALMVDGQATPFRTYFEQITMHTDAVVNGDVSLMQKVYTYLLLFWAHEGLLVCALIALATGSLLRERRIDGGLLLLVLFWLPLLFFLVSRNQAVYRYAAGAVLPASLLAAVALERLLQEIGEKVRWKTKWVRGLTLCGVIAVNFSHIRPIYSVESAWDSAAAWLVSRAEKQVVSTAGRTLWAVNGIENIDPQSGLGQARYLAVYKRYPSPRERAVLQNYGRAAEPVIIASHRRPDKLLEVAFLTSNPVLDSIGWLPGIGSFIANMRTLALEMNRLHVLEIYELDVPRGVDSRSSAVSTQEGGRG